MEEEMLVGDVVSQIADDPGFDGMGFRTPFVGGGGKNVEAAWMREVKFLFLIFPGALSVVGAVFVLSGRRGERAGRASVGVRGASGAVSLAMVFFVDVYEIFFYEDLFC
jgi:hypothetical protein